MAKAVRPIAVDVLHEVEGEQQVPCVTLSPSEASDNNQAEVSGGGPCQAGGAPGVPAAEKRGYRGVHVLFLALVVLATLPGVSCRRVTLSERIGFRFEFTARIVVEAAPKWLGNMAKAVRPIAVDVLLRTADLVKRGIGGG